jgi:lipopolysaccharide export system protein LptC
LRAKAAGEAPKSKRRWPKVVLLVIVASGIAYVVRGKAMAQEEQPVPEPRQDESAKPESAKQDAAANAQLNGQHQKSSSAKN